MATANEKLRNYVGNKWVDSAATEYLQVLNPATTEVLAKVPLSPASEVDAAVQIAFDAFHE